MGFHFLVVYLFGLQSCTELLLQFESVCVNLIMEKDGGKKESKLEKKLKPGLTLN
jgi:hypothetical protein